MSPAIPHNFCSCLLSPCSGFTLCPGDVGSRRLGSHRLRHSRGLFPSSATVGVTLSQRAFFSRVALSNTTNCEHCILLTLCRLGFQALGTMFSGRTQGQQYL